MWIFWKRRLDTSDAGCLRWGPLLGGKFGGGLWVSDGFGWAMAAMCWWMVWELYGICITILIQTIQCHTIMILCISHSKDHFIRTIMTIVTFGITMFWMDFWWVPHGWKLSSKPRQGRTVKLLIHCRVLYPIIIWYLYPHFWRVLGGPKWMLSKEV